MKMRLSKPQKISEQSKREKSKKTSIMPPKSVNTSASSKKKVKKRAKVKKFKTKFDSLTATEKIAQQETVKENEKMIEKCKNMIDDLVSVSAIAKGMDKAADYFIKNDGEKLKEEASQFDNVKLKNFYTFIKSFYDKKMSSAEKKTDFNESEFIENEEIEIEDSSSSSSQPSQPFEEIEPKVKSTMFNSSFQSTNSIKNIMSSKTTYSIKIKTIRTKINLTSIQLTDINVAVNDFLYEFDATNYTIASNLLENLYGIKKGNEAFTTLQSKIISGLTDFQVKESGKIDADLLLKSYIRDFILTKIVFAYIGPYFGILFNNIYLGLDYASTRPEEYVKLMANAALGGYKVVLDVTRYDKSILDKGEEELTFINPYYYALFETLREKIISRAKIIKNKVDFSKESEIKEKNPLHESEKGAKVINYDEKRKQAIEKHEERAMFTKSKKPYRKENEKEKTEFRKKRAIFYAQNNDSVIFDLFSFIIESLRFHQYPDVTLYILTYFACKVSKTNTVDTGSEELIGEISSIKTSEKFYLIRPKQLEITSSSSVETLFNYNRILRSCFIIFLQSCTHIEIGPILTSKFMYYMKTVTNLNGTYDDNIFVSVKLTPKNIVWLKKIQDGCKKTFKFFKEDSLYDDLLPAIVEE